MFIVSLSIFISLYCAIHQTQQKKNIMKYFMLYRNKTDFSCLRYFALFQTLYYHPSSIAEECGLIKKNHWMSTICAEFRLLPGQMETLLCVGMHVIIFWVSSLQRLKKTSKHHTMYAHLQSGASNNPHWWSSKENLKSLEFHY